MTDDTDVTELGGDAVSEEQVERFSHHDYWDARRAPNMIGFSRNAASVESVPPRNALKRRGRSAADPNRRWAW